MKTIDQSYLTDLTEEEMNQLDGGSEFSEAVFRTAGFIAKFFYYAATEDPIRPSTYR